MAQAWFDGHLDLAYISMHGWDLHKDPLAGEARSTSFPALARGNVVGVAATIFVEPGPEAHGKPWGYADSADWEGAFRAADLQMRYYEGLENSGLARIVRTKRDLDETTPLKLVILMEGADPIRDASHARHWHARGVRMVGLTWAMGTRFSGGNSCTTGLTPEGRELVSALDELSILHDASHLSDAAMDDLMASTKRMIVASHSNARALMQPIQRHIRDDHIREIARRGGVVGLNLYGKFLANDRAATFADAIAHVERVASIAGTREISAMGSDMDGGFAPDCVPEELRTFERYGALTDALATRGWSPRECAGFASNNWLRVLRGVLPD